MKKILNSNLFISVFFIIFVFGTLAGTAAKVFVYRDKYTIDYASYLGESKNPFAKVEALIKTIYNGIATIEDMVIKRHFINIYGLAQRVVGNKFIYDAGGENVIKLNNGYITFIEKRESDLPAKAEKIALFDAHLKSKGINFLYVQPPSKINKRDNKLPTGVFDYSNINSDAMLTELKNRGIPTFDLREEIFRDGLDHYSLFFRTDHHWKPEVGLWASGKIAEKLNIDYGFKIDMSLLDINNFSKTFYKKQFLGSIGKRVGQYYAGVDDFNLLLPKYDTEMSYTYFLDSGASQKKVGSFEDAMIFKENIGNIDYYEKNTYSAFSGGDFPLSICDNKKLAGKKILLIRDSYSCVVSPFLSLAVCKELHTIDPRHFKGSITEYVDAFKPEIVLMLYTSGAFKNMAFFTY